jgi:uncharacterized protein (DUF58 family)
VPTGRGTAIGIAATSFLVAGRLLGIPDFFEIGVALLILVIGGMVVTRRANRAVSVTRAIVPPRVPVGSTTRVEVTIRNPDRHQTPPLIYRDTLPSALPGRARFGVGPIPGRSNKVVHYELVPTRRGIFEVGPGELTFTDPFGSAVRRVELVGGSRITVHPEIETLIRGGDLGERFGAGRMRRMTPTVSGGEFFTLREFQAGDDLKKIHWASTARLGKLMLKQEEQLSQMLATIVLDDRRSLHHRGAVDSFEQSVRSAASLVHLYIGAGFYVRLSFAGTSSSPKRDEFGRGTDHYNRLLDSLAVAATCEEGDLAGKLAALRATSTGGVLAVITTEAEEAHAALTQRLIDRSSFKIAVIHPIHDFRTPSRMEAERRERQLDGALRLMTDAGISPVVSRAGRPLAEAWSERLVRALTMRGRVG